jgi:predicted RNA binding protein YcfA (HicA-like mRNA interferase family)
MTEFPAIKSRRLLRVLMSAPLNYEEVRRSGSHRRLKAEGRPTLTWAYHDGRTLSPVEVRRVLVNQVGLAEDEALKLL